MCHFAWCIVQLCHTNLLEPHRIYLSCRNGNFSKSNLLLEIPTFYSQFIVRDFITSWWLNLADEPSGGGIKILVYKPNFVLPVGGAMMVHHFWHVVISNQWTYMRGLNHITPSIAELGHTSCCVSPRHGNNIWDIKNPFAI